MADDAEATLREGLIARLNSGERAYDPESLPGIASSRRSRKANAVHLFPVFFVLFGIAVSVWGALPGASAGESRETFTAPEHASGTPVSAVSDPLDGPGPEATASPDPLDGAPQIQFEADDGATEDIDSLQIVRSGRSRSAPDSSVAYDGDFSTSWPASEVESNWIWFDLGATARIRELRWLTTGSGSLTVEVSDDRREWREIGEASLERAWTGLEARGAAQYVRLTFSEDASEDAALVEFAAFGLRRDEGTGGRPSADLAQERKQRAGVRQDKRDKGERRAQRATSDSPVATDSTQEDTGNSGLSISTKPGKTKCKGDKAKCRANEGKTRVEENCTTEGTCVIDVQADGGSAICDASGGDENELGQGEGKQPGRGGRCEATADGGTVTIGDINP